MQLFVDDGVASRGHRTNLFSDSTVTGNASGPHEAYGSMTCATYAGTYEDSVPDDASLSIGMSEFAMITIIILDGCLSP